jgi:hypothetical protein
MQRYDQASDLPFSNVGGVSVPKLILGHLPFVGESYQGAAKNRAYRERFAKVENTVTIMKKAVEEYGVTAFAHMPSTEGTRSERLVEAIRETMKATSVEIALIPCFRIPLQAGDESIDDYRRWVTYYAIEKEHTGDALLGRYVDDPILQARAGWEERFPTALAQLPPYDREEIKTLQIDHQRLEAAVRSLRGLKVLIAEPGSETDFLAMTGRLDLLDEVVGTLRERLNCPVFVATHHAGSTIPILDRGTVAFDGYLTPINRLGVMMFPSQAAALTAIQGTEKPIIAIKPLAGGRIRPAGAFNYVYNDQKIEACMVGVGSERELDEDLQAVQHVLQGGQFQENN